MMSDIVLMQLVGINVVLVRRRSEISAMLKKIGKESKFVGGMRYTDQETMDIVQQVLWKGKQGSGIAVVGGPGRQGGGAFAVWTGSMLKADKLEDDLGLWERSGRLRMRPKTDTSWLFPPWLRDHGRPTTSMPMWRPRMRRA